MASRYDYENATARISKVDVSEVMRNLEKFGPATKQAVLRYLDSCCPELENYMKVKAKWTDRTGNLRRTLTAKAVDRKNYTGIILAMNQEYGKYLEYGTKNYSPKTKYAILHPTANEKFPGIVSGMRGLLRNRRYMQWM